MANRHGLIAGATGTGKTITMQGLAEGFSEIGVPVFLADIKGDVSGVTQPGREHPKVAERVEIMNLDDFNSLPETTYLSKFRRKPSAKIAGKGQILGDIITPVVPVEDWGVLA